MCEIYSNHSKSQILKHLVNLKYNKSIKKYLKLIDIISSTDFLKKCYLFIKSNLRNSTFSNNGETWNGINSKRFQKISREIKDGTYQPKSSRVVHIKKKNDIYTKTRFIYIIGCKRFKN